jgi:hypothetical protein
LDAGVEITQTIIASGADPNMSAFDEAKSSDAV